MAETTKPPPRKRLTLSAWSDALIHAYQPVVWLLALATGVGVGYAAILFRLAIQGFQYLAFGTTAQHAIAELEALPWWHVAFAPALGGLVVGLVLQRVIKAERTQGVADVIEARLLLGGRLGLRSCLGSALVTALSLGVGASAGREGPVVHLGAGLASQVAQRFSLPPIYARTLLGCGVAAAVSASFNAPIAGVLFALEVVLGHYALSAFGPIVIASVAGAVITRAHLGDYPAFTVPSYHLMSYTELPAFALLGLIGAGVAIVFMRALLMADDAARRIDLPLWARPAIGGLAVGLVGVFFPQVLGVGYGATNDALNELYPLGLLLVLIVFKIATTAVSIASRFGGGVFSPSLFIGAMTGGAFGIMAGWLFPSVAASHGLYTLVGMGAVAACVLGAPISTTLIVFELSGDWEIGLALLVSVSIATVVTQAALGRSYFHLQLERRGLPILRGPHRYILRSIRVRDVMTTENRLTLPLGEPGPILYTDDTLEHALNLLDPRRDRALAVKVRGGSADIVGFIDYIAAITAYNRALIDTHVEEHR